MTSRELKRLLAPIFKTIHAEVAKVARAPKRSECPPGTFLVTWTIDGQKPSTGGDDELELKLPRLLGELNSSLRTVQYKAILSKVHTGTFGVNPELPR